MHGNLNGEKDTHIIALDKSGLLYYYNELSSCNKISCNLLNPTY